MDLSQLRDAMTSKSYENIADICDELMLQIASSQGVAFQEEWPYAIHMLAHIYVNDLDSARFLWKSMPSAVKERNPEVVAAWKIGQRLWTRDYSGVYAAIREFNWSPEVLDLVQAFIEIYRKRMFQLLLSAYSTVSVADTARFMGMNEQDAANYAVQNGWTLDASSQMLTVCRKPVLREQKVNSNKLQSLTEYVFHLEH